MATPTSQKKVSKVVPRNLPDMNGFRTTYVVARPLSPNTSLAGPPRSLNVPLHGLRNFHPTALEKERIAIDSPRLEFGDT